ncbi:MAG: hypothetical protein IPP71_09225 [Bacteroidetes bacterium]|nr:hypothetical protein [Bacteroidota bacterium]
MYWIIYNVTYIGPEQPTGLVPFYFGCEFSASSKYVDVSNNDDVGSRIVQFDLLAPILLPERYYRKFFTSSNWRITQART